MEFPAATVLRIGDWRVDTESGEISRDGETARLDVRTVRLLRCLAEHAGKIVSIDDLLTYAWSGVTVSPDSVYQAVASLRRILGDDPKEPTYIATVPRLGYRMVATVAPWAEEPIASPIAHSEPAQCVESKIEPVSPPNNTPGRHMQLRGGFAWAAALTLVLALVAIFLLHRKTVDSKDSAPAALAAQTQKSIAVLPFLDLTEGMKEEEFADGMTEELIDKISKLSGFRVPPPTSSFFYKGKQIPVSDIAHALGVAYVLDGSVRKSGARLRVAARLIRAENGFVVWSETYDRPFGDIIMVQDDIAGEVTKALRKSIDAGADHNETQ